MDRALRLSHLWTWLPSFRAVAETEHLPTAARAMGLTPSALSRSVAQLEAAVETKLFARVGRRLQLEPAGRELLAAVRDAMRRIDDSVDGLGTQAPKSVRVAGDGAWIGVLVTPITSGFELEHVPIETSIRDALQRGSIDLAVVETVMLGGDILIDRLGSVPQSVYGTGDRFAACTSRDEAWPSHVARAITLRTPSLGVIVDACRVGGLQAVLPVAIGDAHGLRSHPAPRLPPASLYLARRKPLGTSAVDALVPAIVTRAREVLLRRVSR
jgi:DNA-binding transcriptional LysR family regulator